MCKTSLMLLFLLSIVHTTTGADYLDITEVRLVDGYGKFSGRVEIKVDGVWGTICDNAFDMNDAKVICKSLNLTATSFFTGAHYGLGKGPVFAQRFHCYGHESHLRGCGFDPNTFCSHSRDIGVICTECGEIDIKNGIIESISSNGSVLTTSCVTDYQTNMHTSICQTNGTWSNDITCATIGYPLNITDIRLVNGIGLTDGIVELKVNGTWGQICRNNFNSIDAKVICKMLGFNYWLYDSSSKITSNPYHLDKLECIGTEDHINECLYDVRQTCSSSYPTVVECKYPYNITDVRLVGGTGPYDGRVEVKINDGWGTVCSRYIGSYDADTLCKSMDLKLTSYFSYSSVYGQGTGAIYIGDMGCSATKTHVNQCSFVPPRRRYCSHSRDMSLVCTPCGKPTIQYGSFSSFNGTVLTAKCDVGYQPETITFDCHENGTWLQTDKCSSKYSYPLEIRDLKLVNSYGHHEGRVEIQVDGIWGTICSNNFTITEANVICHMLGLEASHINTDTWGDGPVFITNLQCNGNESQINNCSYNVDNNCLYTQSAGVHCTGYQLNVTGWRLAGTNGPYHGRVELEVNGTWGTICSSWFYNDNLGTVICNMFGLR
ncbi:scavenger receptor cysteine-rich type 1 protein M130-like [Ruditapes philippinarum]|uniref:scavenger receptor cysteine-rich type 1 protein M130-like n=1 Tax=Ruditapes philippinarum TaxID=129788 RepID=UPI00295A7025|nr:scavenger receptor cysteine-rich type 1 protein M130-like [Ruditapes philippinarum]